MANQKHINKLMKGVDFWNVWRDKNPKVIPDLKEVDFSGHDLDPFYLPPGSGDELEPISYLSFKNINLQNADLRKSIFSGKYFLGSNLKNAKLQDAQLNDVLIKDADLSGANLCGANLRGARIIRTKLNEVDFTGAKVYGISVWDVPTFIAKQENLNISREGEVEITVDNIEVAQFLHLLLNNEKVRNMIDAITTKVVLILGRFTPERKVILDGIREILRQRDFLPIMFDNDKPKSRNFIETITTLAHISRFIIADITDPKSVPQELQAIVPNLPSVKVQPILLSSSEKYSLFEHIENYSQVFDVFHYNQLADIVTLLDKIIPDITQKKTE
jgi:hypothetical protein